MYFRRIAVCLTLIVASALPTLSGAENAAAATAAAATYDFRLAEARRLAGEGSWAQARDAYADALKLAPDADARRWCELWLADSVWRGGEPGDWQARQVWEMRHKAAFDQLLDPYTKGHARDGFWAAATEALGSFKGRQFSNLALEDWYGVATYLGEQPRTAAASDRLMRFLQRVVGDPDVQPWQLIGMLRFLPLLARGSEVGHTPDQRARELNRRLALEGGPLCPPESSKGAETVCVSDVAGGR